MQDIGQRSESRLHGPWRELLPSKRIRPLIAYRPSWFVSSLPRIIETNAVDVERAKKGVHDAAFIDRLTMTAKTVESMALGLEQIVRLEDPIGKISPLKRQASGIELGQMRVPLGVIGIIYESRPNVTIDAAALVSQVR